MSRVEHKLGDADATPGVGVHEWGADPLRRAQMQRSSGGVILVVAIAGFVLAFIALTFGLAPLAFPILALLVPFFFLGRWLRARGTTKLREMSVRVARDERTARTV